MDTYPSHLGVFRLLTVLKFSDPRDHGGISVLPPRNDPLGSDPPDPIHFSALSFPYETISRSCKAAIQWARHFKNGLVGKILFK